MTTKEATVLVVDDQPANLQVLISFLEQHNFEIRIAENGERAIENPGAMLPQLQFFAHFKNINPDRPRIKCLQSGVYCNRS